MAHTVKIALPIMCSESIISKENKIIRGTRQEATQEEEQKKEQYRGKNHNLITVY